MVARCGKGASEEGTIERGVVAGELFRRATLVDVSEVEEAVRSCGCDQTSYSLGRRGAFGSVAYCP